MSNDAAWNVHDRESMREMIALGVDGIETDYPGLLKALLAETGSRVHRHRRDE